MRSSKNDYFKIFTNFFENSLSKWSNINASLYIYNISFINITLISPVANYILIIISQGMLNNLLQCTKVSSRSKIIVFLSKKSG